MEREQRGKKRAEGRGERNRHRESEGEDRRRSLSKNYGEIVSNLQENMCPLSLRYRSYFPDSLCS